MHIEDIYISLIVRHLKKEISEEEKLKLFKWVYAKSENEKFFYNLKDVWESAKYEQITKSADTDKEWEKLALAAIEKESEHFHEKKEFTRRLYRAIQIAAIVIFTFGIGFFVQKMLPEEEMFTSVNVPYGAKTQVVLPDGSKVWVNSGSTLRYPTNFNERHEDLYLEGEAFFDIVKNPNRKLNVKTSSINIQVLGTRFNVKSYNDDDLVETTLVNGSISITGNVGNKAIKEPILLKPNEQAILIKSKNEMSLKSTAQNGDSVSKFKINDNTDESMDTYAKPKLKITEGIDIESFVSWKDNRLVFKDERFDKLAVRMERWYDVEIVINDDVLKSKRYTGTFEKETIEQALKALSLSLPFTYQLDKNEIQINHRLIN